jgi:2-polyprenyl-6-methoxyphenol hydroxylase-like FAD-dependent oxidoreductase
MIAKEHVPVLIVGAGGAGLSLSLLLQQQGIHSMLVERRPDVSWYPRARNLNFRTLEVFRGLGLEAEIRSVSMPVSHIISRARLASTDQKELLDPSSLLDASPFSPEPAFRYFPQSRTQPILLATARARGVDVRYNTELAQFIQNKSTVAATLRDRANGTSYLIEADYLVRTDVAVEILEVSAWQPAQSVAEHFQVGRVFLLGDAAHTVPPKEGLGVNSAIQSAQNLGWKLATVLQGQASPTLLSTYEDERRPVGWFAAQHSLTGPGTALLENVPERQKASEFFPIVGYRYGSMAVVSRSNDAVTNAWDIALLDRQELTGEPGTRIPHLWLYRNSVRISTLDLFDGSFVLLTGGKGDAWWQAASRVAAALGVKLAAYRVGPAADLAAVDNDWEMKVGITSDGAILVRPDGFVAWRASRLSDSAGGPQQQLDQVFSQILGKTATSNTAKANAVAAD